MPDDVSVVSLDDLHYGAVLVCWPNYSRILVFLGFNPGNEKEFFVFDGDRVLTWERDRDDRPCMRMLRFTVPLTSVPVIDAGSAVPPEDAAPEPDSPS